MTEAVAGIAQVRRTTRIELGAVAEVRRTMMTALGAVAGIASVRRTTMTVVAADGKAVLAVEGLRTTMTALGAEVGAVAGIAQVRRTTMTGAEVGAAAQVRRTMMTGAEVGAEQVRRTVAQVRRTTMTQLGAVQVRRTMKTELGAELRAAAPSSILLTCFPRNRSPHFQATTELRKSSPWSTLIYLSYISILRLTV